MRCPYYSATGLSLILDDNRRCLKRGEDARPALEHRLFLPRRQADRELIIARRLHPAQAFDEGGTGAVRVRAAMTSPVTCVLFGRSAIM